MKNNRATVENLTKKYAVPEKRRLDEALVKQAKQYWPKFSMSDIVKISTFSSDWQTSSLFGSFKTRFKIAAINVFENAVKNSQSLRLYLEQNGIKIQCKGSVGADGMLRIQPASMIVNCRNTGNTEKIDGIVKSFVGKNEGFEYGGPQVNRKTIEKKNKQTGEKHAVEVVQTNFRITAADSTPKEKYDAVFDELTAEIQKIDAENTAFRRTESDDTIEVQVSGTIFNAFAVFEYFHSGATVSFVGVPYDKQI